MDNILALECDLTREGGERVSDAVFNSQVTGVFCSNDLIAVGIYEEARKRNISIPEDLSIIGFDNISFSEILHPKLTTIQQPTQLLAQKITEHLVQMMNNPDYQFESEILPVTLVERASVRNLKSL